MGRTAGKGAGQTAQSVQAVSPPGVSRPWYIRVCSPPLLPRHGRRVLQQLPFLCDPRPGRTAFFSLAGECSGTRENIAALVQVPVGRARASCTAEAAHSRQGNRTRPRGLAGWLAGRQG